MAIISLVFWLVFYIVFQTESIYGADAGDLAGVAYLQGVPHPPGFPLYTFIGHWLTKLPIKTVAWRVGLLSSIPSAFTLFFLYLILRKIFKKQIIPLITVLAVGFSYPFWLYSSIVEVYSLNCLFSLILVYLLLQWKSEKKQFFLFLFFLVLGFAIAHHQIILFLLPAFFCWLYQNRQLLPKNKIKLIFNLLILASLGLFSYLYTFLVAKDYPLISWENPVNFKGLVDIFSRHSYGTFTSGIAYGQHLKDRLVQLPAYFYFIEGDFSLIGVVLIIIGFCQRIIKFRKLKEIDLFFLLLFIFSGPIYYFYASYYIGSSFQISIFEQFLSFSYPFLAFYLTSAFIFIFSLMMMGFKKITPNMANSSLIKYLLLLLFLLYPLTLFYINYPKISILKKDFTAEKLAIDTLKTVEENSILILQQDTILFDTQYVFFTEKKWPEIKLFHFAKLVLKKYNPQIRKYYPEIKLGDKEPFISEFINLNYDYFPIYSHNAFDTGLADTIWVRYGLLYRLYKEKDVPQIDEVIKTNEKLWAEYQDPLQGSLGKYKNLALSNILDIYEQGYRETGEMLLRAGSFTKAIPYLDKAQKLVPQNPGNFYLQGLAFLELQKCHEAEEALQKAILLEDQVPDYYDVLSQIYQKCFNDQEKAKHFSAIYEKMKKEAEIQLEEL